MSGEESVFNDGAVYERLMGRWSKLVGHEFLDWIAPAQGLSWLDVGCGNGAFTEEIIARCAPAKVDAVDPSEGQLVYARNRAGTKRAQFRIADAQSLPFDKGSFDVVAMSLVIAFIPDPAKAVAEMARVTRPGGTVATYMWDFSIEGLPVEPLRRAMARMGIEFPRPPSHAVATCPALQELWTKAGLQAVETRYIRIDTIYTGLDDYWDSNVGTVGPHAPVISRMGPEARERLRQELRQELPSAPDGRIVVPAVSSAVKGRMPA